tara:strand:- start:965 stop:1870 length:906 start_codon:yes stop_codon:yes gene_type:complete
MIRIGTRKSALAFWQANQVKNSLEKLGYKSIIISIKSDGDKELKKPLHEMGIQGIFTKTLDHSLLDKKIDIAVHSLKDVPTLLPKEIEISACLKRGLVNDVLVYHPNFLNWEKSNSIGTGSLRRKAQWLRKYPNHRIENLRGNIETRLEKMKKSSWGGAIFAQAGLHRLNLLDENFLVLDWMIPAPSQGIIGITSLIENKNISKIVKKINCSKTYLCAGIERNFLRTLEGGCTAPIGANAFIDKEVVYFKYGLFSLDGKKAIVDECKISIDELNNVGEKIAKNLLKNGGSNLMREIKSRMK